MCYQCRSSTKLSPEQIITQLKEFTSYEEFNTTSVGFILYSCMGMDGLDAKQVALEVLSNFINYVKTRSPYYIPKTGIEPMLHPNVLVNLHSWCEKFTNSNSLSNDELVELLGRKINEFIKKQANYELGIGLGLGTGIGIVLGILYWKYKK
jgi:hypothetical protein